MIMMAGEYGIVYKAHLFNFKDQDNGLPMDVAVKTVKGMHQFCIHDWS